MHVSTEMELIDKPLAPQINSGFIRLIRVLKIRFLIKRLARELEIIF